MVTMANHLFGIRIRIRHGGTQSSGDLFVRQVACCGFQLERALRGPSIAWMRLSVEWPGLASGRPTQKNIRRTTHHHFVARKSTNWAMVSICFNSYVGHYQKLGGFCYEIASQELREPQE